ncbi:hypothetical protein PG993_012449 [Apiospora rasikravindrae]|uniref:Mid2 domain-containing protein n=1 Tax=Apiospora rasikravindrae TaxID=990691 RepID=A0ABR1S2Y5_9PEZI
MGKNISRPQLLWRCALLVLWHLHLPKEVLGQNTDTFVMPGQHNTEPATTTLSGIFITGTTISNQLTNSTEVKTITSTAGVNGDKTITSTITVTPELTTASSLPSSLSAPPPPTISSRPPESSASNNNDGSNGGGDLKLGLGLGLGIGIPLIALLAFGCFLLWRLWRRQIKQSQTQAAADAEKQQQRQSRHEMEAVVPREIQSNEFYEAEGTSRRTGPVELDI